MYPPSSYVGHSKQPQLNSRMHPNYTRGQPKCLNQKFNFCVTCLFTHAVNKSLSSHHSRCHRYFSSLQAFGKTSENYSWVSFLPFSTYVWIECHISTIAFEIFRSRIVGCKSSSVIRIHIRIISGYIASSVHSVRGRIPSVFIFSCNNGRNKIDNFSPFLPTATLLAPRRLLSDSRRVSLSVSRLRSCSRFFCASRVCLCRCREAGGAMLHVITSFNMQRTLTNSI